MCDAKYKNESRFNAHLPNIHLTASPTSDSNLIQRMAPPVLDLIKKHCNVYDRAYRSLGSYWNHLPIYHQTAKVLSKLVNRNEISVIDKVNNFCTACNKVYKNRPSYKLHLHKIHGIILPRLREINHDIIPDMNDKNNYCASRNRTYSCKGNYTHHLALFHSIRKLEIKQEDTKKKLDIRLIRKKYILAILFWYVLHYTYSV